MSNQTLITIICIIICGAVLLLKGLFTLCRQNLGEGLMFSTGGLILIIGILAMSTV